MRYLTEMHDLSSRIVIRSLAGVMRFGSHALLPASVQYVPRHLYRRMSSIGDVHFNSLHIYAWTALSFLSCWYIQKDSSSYN